MSFAARLVHTVSYVHVTHSEDETGDDVYGQPEATTATATVSANVQPRSGREMADSRSAGTDVGDHVIFLPIGLEPAPGPADYFVWEGARYDVVHIRPFRFGRSPHYEIDARLVTPAATVAAGS